MITPVVVVVESTRRSAALLASSPNSRRPELVVEIACNEVQTSPHYPGGMALRFARVKRYRDDKTAAEADTVATVRAFRDRGSG